MEKEERILLLMQRGGEWTAHEIGTVLGLWFSPYGKLHKMESEGKIMSRWEEVPRPELPDSKVRLRRRVYFIRQNNRE